MQHDEARDEGRETGDGAAAGTAACDGAASGRRARRAAAMVAAAHTLFVARGFDAVSLTEVVRHSGGSLATLYALFGNKLGLLRAVVDAARYDGIGRLRAILDRDGAPADVLTDAALHLMGLMEDPDFVGLVRLVMSEALSSPEFACQVHAGTNDPLITEFTALFRRWTQTGVVDIPDPVLSARMFNSLFFQAPQLRVMFHDANPHDRCRTTNLRAAVDRFMAGATVRLE